jgi:hypothetical protein
MIVSDAYHGALLKITHELNELEPVFEFVLVRHNKWRWRLRITGAFGEKQVDRLTIPYTFSELRRYLRERLSERRARSD